MLTSAIFKIASDFLGNLGIDLAKKGIQKLTRPVIEDMVKEYLEKQPKTPDNNMVIIDNSIDNSINVTAEVFSLMEVDNRYVLENDVIFVRPVNSQAHLSDVQLRAKLATLQETIQRRKLEQEQIKTTNVESENNDASPTVLSDNMDITTQNAPSTPIVPKVKSVSESTVTVELSPPDAKKLKLLQPAKPLELLVTPSEVDDPKDNQQPSRGDYIRQKVKNIQSKIKIRKVERGEE